MFRTVDTVWSADSTALLRLSRLDSIRCDLLDVELEQLQELDDSIALPDPDSVASIMIRRIS
ncbi:MAG: hypothetical protein AB7T31_15035 [Gemmatimonadales bacterium]